MDVLGASMLSARIRAGVRIGQMIELLRDSATDPQLKRGALGLVTGFTASGKILVKWSGSPATELDPATESYEPILPPLAHSA